MTSSPPTKDALPAGFHTLNIHVSVHGSRELIEGLKKVFDAEARRIETAPDGRVMNAEVQIGDSTFMIGEQLPDQPTFPAQIYMYVDNVDVLYQRAVETGWKSIEEPCDKPYGDRRAAVKDPAGNQWWMARRL